MTKTKKVVLAVASVVIIGLLVYVGISGGSLGEVKCMDCHGSGIVESADCPSCDAEGTTHCTLCHGSGKIDDKECTACKGEGTVECAECHGEGSISNAVCSTCDGSGNVRGSAWALLPPIIAIGLALITKEVYSSLFVGIVVGGLMYTNFDFLATMDAITGEGLITAVTDNAGIFIFLVELGVIVALVNKSGGSAAFGKWAATHIKSRTGAMLATFVLGVLIFIDDYFNCLTVGSVMRPVTDGHKVSRSKLAYLIDATAAPVCMIAPISSWAAAVSSYAEDGQGLKLFMMAIPYNFYSLLTFVFIIAICVLGFDYGSMAMHEYNAMYKDDLYTTGDRVSDEDEKPNEKGRVIDLLLPILVLIGVCVFALVYNGGILSGSDFITAFADTDATVGLPWGGLIALVFTIAYLNARKVINFKEAMESIPKGFFAMVPPILILTFATALKNMTSLMGAKYFVADIMNGAAAGLANFLPAIIFLVACVLSFATGTSWGTFGILIPIVTYLFAGNTGSPLMIIGISACLAGAVCGDHCSPISDTTIMSSAGAQCNHINHVSTQLPYALTVAGVSFVSFVIAGFVQNAVISLAIAVVLMIAVIVALRMIIGKKVQK
ncbi:MAG: Na+/H+ antiporter NhaC family protein [Ruminococcus sp.]|nr:Na+/H+ antiporter NhaC family protein [Ruminococcus sp.]